MTFNSCLFFFFIFCSSITSNNLLLIKLSIKLNYKILDKKRIFSYLVILIIYYSFIIIFEISKKRKNNANY